MYLQPYIKTYETKNEETKKLKLSLNNFLSKLYVNKTNKVTKNFRMTIAYY